MRRGYGRPRSESGGGAEGEKFVRVQPFFVGFRGSIVVFVVPVQIKLRVKGFRVQVLSLRLRHRFDSGFRVNLFGECRDVGSGIPNCPPVRASRTLDFWFGFLIFWGTPRSSCPVAFIMQSNGNDWKDDREHRKSNMPT